jgi:hypothetical protein
MNAMLSDKLWRLADRILTGDVVFFIGSGFSIDSEGNTTRRLTSLLLARLIALVGYLDKGPWTLPEPEAESEIRKDARDLFAGFCSTFVIRGELAEPARIFNHEVVGDLSRQYYRFNDWITSAYGRLMDKVAMIIVQLCDGQKPEPRAAKWIETCTEAVCGRIVDEVALSETYFLKRLGELRVDILAPMPLKRILALGSGSRGKILFLETLGFNNKEVMAGDTWEHTMDAVQASFQHRIRERHIILGRLARVLYGCGRQSRVSRAGDPAGGKRGGGGKNRWIVRSRQPDRIRNRHRHLSEPGQYHDLDFSLDVSQTSTPGPECGASADGASIPGTSSTPRAYHRHSGRI